MSADSKITMDITCLDDLLKFIAENNVAGDFRRLTEKKIRQQADDLAAVDAEYELIMQDFLKRYGAGKLQLETLGRSRALREIFHAIYQKWVYCKRIVPIDELPESEKMTWWQTYMRMNPRLNKRAREKLVKSVYLISHAAIRLYGIQKES